MSVISMESVINIVRDFRGVYNPRKTHLCALLWHCWEHQYRTCQRDLSISSSIFYPFKKNSIILVFFITLGKPKCIKKRKGICILCPSMCI